MFLASSAAAVAAGCASTGKAPGKLSSRSPNEMLNVAGIGVGGKGASDIDGAGKHANVVALCDVDFDTGRQSFERMPDLPRFQDYRVMLDKMGKDIDLCTVSTPDHMHAIIAMHCMNLGKGVYVQKPLTKDIYEARMLTEAARKCKVATQMGNQGHCHDGVRQFCEMVWSGAIGQVREAHCWTNRPIWPQGISDPLPEEPVPSTLDWDLWLGGAPERPYNSGYCPFKWRGWWDFGCGALGDMACHIMDPPNWALKLNNPLSVEVVSQDGKNDQTAPNTSILKYEFGPRGDMPALTLYWHDGGNLPPYPEGLSEDIVLGDGDGKNGTLLIGDSGFMTCGTYGGNPRLLPDALMADYAMPSPTIPRIKDEDPYLNWIEAAKGGEPSASNFDYAGPFTEIVLLGNLALRTGQKIEWDAANMKVTNVVEANQYIQTNYRTGWSL
jgi:predicted dehydrogenase